MSYLQKVQLYYHLVHKRWSLKVNQSTINSLNDKRKIVTWGAEKRPLTLYLSAQPKEIQGEQVACQALLDTDEPVPYLQPLIGILTTRKEGHLPFGGRKDNFIDIIKTGRSRGGIVFVFTPQNVHWKSRTIAGYLYHFPSKQWKKCRFPFPNVVYNRIPTRAEENTKIAEECIRKLKQVPNLHLFNPHFFNKDELYQILKQSPQLSRYLPATRRLQIPADLKQMLDAYQHVYLKPTKGKAGAGIMRVTKRSTQQYTLYVQKKQQLKKIETNSLGGLWGMIQEYAISSPYVVQQGIHLARINRCPFDFRVLVQKNAQGKWELAGLGMRVAGVNRITTHVPRGGRIERPAKVLNQLYAKETAAQIEKRVERLALTIAEELEQNYSLLGELSMDIGLDTQGNLWFFEANSKPMKFDEPDIRRRSLTNIIYFSQYLTQSKRKVSGLVHVHR